MMYPPKFYVCIERHILLLILQLMNEFNLLKKYIEFQDTSGRSLSQEIV